MSEREFYDIVHEGKNLKLPRVTSLLGIIDKSAPLMGWATKLEREAMRAALEEVCTAPEELSRQHIFDRVMATVKGRRAWVRARDEAGDIGTEAHALVQWHTHRMLGYDSGPEPAVSDPALRAVVAWLDWCRDVDFTPCFAERIVYCPNCAYAGTLDSIADVSGVRTLIDWKTGKAVYAEAFLQNRAYRHAARREGLHVDGGLILRLPKREDDPSFEAVPVPDSSGFEDFLHAAALWRWRRRQDGGYAGPDPVPCYVESGLTHLGRP